MVASSRQIALDSMETSILVADLRCFINISEYAQTVYKNIHNPPHNNYNFQPAYQKYQPHTAKWFSLLCSLVLRAVSQVIFVERGVL